MTEYDLLRYQDDYDKKYRGVTQVRTLVDAIFDVANQKELIKVHDLYHKPLPTQPSRFKERIIMFFNNSDILDVVTVDDNVFKIYGTLLPQPENVARFVEYCDAFEYKLFWDKDIYNSYFYV